METAGVGYKIKLVPNVLPEIKKTNEEISLWVHTHVREDTLDLYGFLDHQELEFFEMLINVPGIGPKGALIILGIASIETLKQAFERFAPERECSSIYSGGFGVNDNKLTKQAFAYGPAENVVCVTIMNKNKGIAAHFKKISKSSSSSRSKSSSSR